MEILEYLKNNIVYLDGGMGTLLQQKGITTEELPESWNITHSEDIINIHKSYFDSGSNIVYTNTFGANTVKIEEEKLEDIIKAGVECAKKARLLSSGAQEKFIAGDIGPLGKLLKPYGDLDFEEAVKIYKKTAVLLEKYGVDLIVIETLNDLYDTKAALLAVKEATSLPVFVSNAYLDNDMLLTGATPEAAVAMIEAMGADAVGLNCSFGPEKLLSVAKRIVSVSSIPVLFKPNAGLPKIIEGKNVFDSTPEEFSDFVLEAVKSGVKIVGGCCGTTQEYIEKVIEKTKDIKVPVIEKKDITVITSGEKAKVFDKVMLIGERINPTGNKKIKEAIKEENISVLLSEAIKEQEYKADIIDVNAGVPGIDEVAFLEKAVSSIQSVVNLPLSIDSSNVNALEKALRIYNGKALVNSVNGKEESMNSVFPLIKKYGGVVIALTLDENGIPEDSDGRVQIAKKILKRAEEFGIDKKDIIFDALTMSVSTNENAGNITVGAVKRIKEELSCHTVLGVSNISFGMPDRDEINSKFFLYAMQNGLSSAIMNPFSEKMMKSFSDFTGNKDTLVSFTDTVDKSMSDISSKDIEINCDNELQYAIIKGLKDKAKELTEKLLKDIDGLKVVNEYIIPSLDIVGKGYEEKTMYLPQLLMSAEAAKASFEAIQSVASKETKNIEGNIVIATVKGDIHDIGKNIVKLLLENYGFDVTDLGKDVDPELILSHAKKNNSKIVCLSALMTTTVPMMEETIRLLRDNLEDIKICVGGAVLTKEYAEKIGADKYAKDAMETVRYAEELLE